MNGSQIGGVVNLGIGVILFMIAFILYNKKTADLKGGILTIGIVKALKKSQGNVFTSGSSDDNLTFREEENMFKNGSYAPVIEFLDKLGNKHEIEGMASSPPGYKIGQQVTILYPENNPEKAIVNSFFEKWGVILILSGIGLILVLFGALILIFVK